MKALLSYPLVAACWLFGALAAVADETKPAPLPEEAKAAALAWLGLVDERKYEESWQAAASAFQSRITAEKWSEALNESRRPLGAVLSREFRDGNHTQILPRSPKGDYWVLQFGTAFDGLAVIEVVTLVLDKDGRWHVLSYSLKSAR